MSSFTNRAQPHLAREKSGWDCAYAVNPNQARCRSSRLFGCVDRPLILKINSRYMRVDFAVKKGKVMHYAGHFNEIIGQIDIWLFLHPDEAPTRGAQRKTASATALATARVTERIMDDLDHKILMALAADSSTSVSRLARRFKVARSTVQARLEKMETNGTIAGYTIKLGDVALARRIKATVLIQVEPRTSASVVSKLKAIHEVEMVATATGRVDLIAQIACETTEEIDRTLDQINAITGVQDIESLIHLSTKFDRAI